MGLFEVLASEDAREQETASGRRAVLAAQIRAKDSFGSFVANAATQEERDARISLISADLDQTLAEVADEYAYGDVERLKNAATVALGGGHPSDCTCGFCENKGSFGKDDDDNKKDEKKDDDSDSDDKDKDDDGDSDDKEEKKLPWEKGSSVRVASRVMAEYDWDGLTKTADGFSFCECNCEGCNSANHCESEKCIETKHSGNPGNPDSAKSSEKTANKYVQKRGDKWVIIQKGTGDVLSEHDSEEKANASFRAMEMHKHEGASVETGDTYVTETVDLPSSKDGLGGPSPKIDKGPSGDNKGWSLPEIEVPSERHPVEKQQIHDTPDYSADLPGVSDTGKSISADAPLQPEFNTADNTETWTGTEGQADPVSNESINVLSKWSVAT